MFQAENPYGRGFEGGFGEEVSQKVTVFKVSFIQQLLMWQSHQKRKTNYEPNEEDRNKLAIGYRLSAIGYRLSAIGYRLILGVLVSICALQVQAACTFFNGFIDNKDGTVTDPRDGLVWKRCAEGAIWDGSSCSVTRDKMDWYSAMAIAKKSQFLGESNWRLPTIVEFQKIRGSGCYDNDSKPLPSVSPMLVHSVTPDSEAIFGIGYWSASSDANDSEALVSYFAGKGQSPVAKVRNLRHIVRLVRGGHASEISRFEKEYEFVLAKQRKTQENIAAEAKQRAYENSPAGRADARKREEESARKRAYENSPAGIAQRQGRQMCEAQKQTCIASCPSYNSKVGLGSRVNDHHFECNSRCDRISCY
jgi:Protein of unknown function (DUF1566)